MSEQQTTNARSTNTNPMALLFVALAGQTIEESTKEILKGVSAHLNAALDVEFKDLSEAQKLSIVHESLTMVARNANRAMAKLEKNNPGLLEVKAELFKNLETNPVEIAKVLEVEHPEAFSEVMEKTGANRASFDA